MKKKMSNVILSVIVGCCISCGENENPTKLDIEKAIREEFKAGGLPKGCLNYSDYVIKFKNLKYEEINLNAINFHNINVDKSKEVFIDLYWVGSIKPKSKLVLKSENHIIKLDVEHINKEKYDKKLSTRFVGYGQALVKKESFSKLGKTFRVYIEDKKGDFYGSGYAGNLRKIAADAPSELSFVKRIEKNEMK